MLIWALIDNLKVIFKPYKLRSRIGTPAASSGRKFTNSQHSHLDNQFVVDSMNNTHEDLHGGYICLWSNISHSKVAKHGPLGSYQSIRS